MDRKARALTIALLCVLAVSLAAATLTNPQQPAGAGEGSGGSILDGDGHADHDADGDGGGSSVDDSNDGNRGNPQLTTRCIPFLTSPTFAVLVGVFYLGLGAFITRRDGLEPAIAVLFLITVAAFPLWTFFTGCSTDLSSPQQGGIAPGFENVTSSDPETGGSSGTSTFFDPPMVLAALAVVVTLLAAVAFRASGDDEPPEQTPVEETPAEPDEEALGALGDVAGEAADRIAEDADVENEVYRAWREMTTHLKVPNPKSSTPAEFAAAAEAVGMSDEHVTELTDLFREVRYGGAPATDERERRAVDALRDIEATYGGDA